MGTARYAPNEMKAIAEHLASRLERVEIDLYADGISPGMVKKMETFMAEHEAREEERKAEIQRRHRQNRFRLNCILAILIPAATKYLFPAVVKFVFKH